MGQFYERILIQEKGMMMLSALVKRAMEELGYTPGEEGKGVSISYKQSTDSEWFEFSSPLLEPSAEMAEPLLKALSKAFRTPLLHLTCVDSDFVLCRLLDEANGTDTTACINEPYEDLGFGEPNYAAWTAACKKKWKCKPEQFKAIFENNYTFAEDGVEPLAALLHFSPTGYVDPGSFMQATDWFLPKEEFSAAPFPRSLSEKLADYMEKEYAEKLETLGYRRFKNNSLRWHKVVGAPGSEVLLSMVLCVRYEECEPFYGAQSLYCPLVLSDKYYPMHDAEGYWKEAKFEYPRKFGRSPLVIRNNPEAGGWDTVLSFNDPKQLPPFIDDLILPELSEVRDLSSCHALYRNSLKEGDIPSLPCPFPSFAERVSRLWIEAALLGDEAETQRLCKEWKKQEKHWTAQEKELWPEAMRACETGGAQALAAYLRGTVYRDNLRKLKRAGIIV